jgi:hypothetical protein
VLPKLSASFLEEPGDSWLWTCIALGRKGWGDGQRAGGVGAACESDATSTPVQMRGPVPSV